MSSTFYLWCFYQKERIDTITTSQIKSWNTVSLSGPHLWIQPTTDLKYWKENNSFIGTQQCSFVYILSVATFALQQQSWRNETDHMAHKTKNIYWYCLAFYRVCQPRFSLVDRCLSVIIGLNGVQFVTITEFWELQHDLVYLLSISLLSP